MISIWLYLASDMMRATSAISSKEKEKSRGLEKYKEGADKVYQSVRLVGDILFCQSIYSHGVSNGLRLFTTIYRLSPLSLNFR